MFCVMVPFPLHIPSLIQFIFWWPTHSEILNLACLCIVIGFQTLYIPSIRSWIGLKFVLRQSEISELFGAGQPTSLSGNWNYWPLSYGGSIKHFNDHLLFVWIGLISLVKQKLPNVPEKCQTRGLKIQHNRPYFFHRVLWVQAWNSLEFGYRKLSISLTKQQISLAIAFPNHILQILPCRKLDTSGSRHQNLR